MPKKSDKQAPTDDSKPREISVRTLQMIDRAAENLRQGVVGPPVDLERLKRLAM